MTTRPPLCQAVAQLIPGAQFEVMEEEPISPSRKSRTSGHARVDAFWQEVEAAA